MEHHNIYSALVEYSDVAIVAKDADGKVLVWNAAAERLLGYSAQEMTGRSVHSLLPPDRLDEDEWILARIRRGEQVAAPFFTRRRHKSGQMVDIAMVASPMRGEGGAIMGVSYIARDASAQVEQQRMLRESEERLQGLADHMAQLAWITRADGAMEWCNARWLEYTGLAAERMAPAAWREVVHPDQFDMVLQGFQQKVMERQGWEDTFQIRRFDGEYRWFLSQAKPVEDEDGRVVRWIGTNTDITEAREREQRIRLLLMEVNHRSKNMLATVQGLARRSAPGNPEFVARFEERVRSLSINQNILVRREWREVPLAELAAGQLSFVEKAPGELAIGGPSCPLFPQTAETIGLALHELATNSMRHGALSVQGGQVEVGWTCAKDRRLFEMWWRESGGPPVTPPTRKGFGTTLIRDAPRHNLCASVTLDYRPEGLWWSLRADERSSPIYTLDG